MAIPFAVTGILTFYTPDFSPRGKLIYAYVTYTAVFMAYTAINIPYGALLGVISSNSLERTSVSTYRFVLAFMGGLVVQNSLSRSLSFLELGLVKTRWPWSTSRDSNHRQTDGVLLDGRLLCMCCRRFVCDYIPDDQRACEADSGDEPSFSSDLGDLARNRPWMVLLAVGLFQILSRLVSW